mgnify:CR=1 FL=1
MLSHIYIGINDFPRAHAFYAPLAELLGLVPKFHDPDRGWAGWKMPTAERPLFVVGRPFDGKRAAPGNGHMIALLAESREVVDRFHAVALAQGGTCEGAPGPRPQYHADYYGAYVRDPEGNKLAIACHKPAA